MIPFSEEEKTHLTIKFANFTIFYSYSETSTIRYPI